jgi:hypothetical protein
VEELAFEEALLKDAGLPTDAAQINAEMIAAETDAQKIPGDGKN